MLASSRICNGLIAWAAFGLSLLVLLPIAACDMVESKAEPDPTLAGGETTLFRATPESFAMPAPNLTGDRLEKHLVGDFEFEKKFVTAPAEVNSGLGPLFNRTSCASCHTRNGRDKPDVSLLVRISSGQDFLQGPVPVAGLGLQIQDRAVAGARPEARVVIEYEEISGSFADGEPYSLRKPAYRLEDLDAPLPAGVDLSPRMARPVFGLGLLEAVSEVTLEDIAAEQAAGGEVSGRINYVWDMESETVRVGRFGWKANQPTVRQQTADAYRSDMGITSPLIPVETSIVSGQHDGLEDDPEISAETVDAVAFYMQTLAVPAARDVGQPKVEGGRTLFTRIGCASCHRPSLETGLAPDLPEVSSQTIFAYTDLLLHDMGEGLADHREDFRAGAREWRTPPLWGVGLTEIVNQHTFFLHDGRARNLKEAILWHDGEASSARERFRTLSRSERDALLEFLRSL